MKINVAINDLTPDQAIAIVSAAKAQDQGTGVTRGTYADAKPEAKPEVKTTNGHANGHTNGAPAEATRGPRMPRVDVDAVDTAATAPAPKKTAAAATKPAKKAAAPPPEADEEEEVEEEAAPPPKKAAAAKTKPRVELEDVEEEDAGDDGVDPRIVNSPKLGDIIKVLMEDGITDEEALVEECTRLRPKVALLQRISNIPERVKRTLEVIEAGGDRV